MMPTGMVMKNQAAHDGWGDMMARAMMFCGDAMGDSMPPTLDARAMPRIRAFDMFESDGRLRSIGYNN